jgi:hypothetical protein
MRAATRALDGDPELRLGLHLAGHADNFNQRPARGALGADVDRRAVGAAGAGHAAGRAGRALEQDGATADQPMVPTTDKVTMSSVFNGASPLVPA